VFLEHRAFSTSHAEIQAKLQVRRHCIAHLDLSSIGPEEHLKAGKKVGDTSDQSIRGVELMSYPKTNRHKDCREADPISIILQNLDFGEIVSYLLQQNWQRTTGHLPPNPAEDLFLDISGKKQPQDRQLVLGSLSYRYHLRLWQYSPGLMVGSAHEEVVTLGYATHAVIEYESAEKLVARTLKQAGRWTVLDDAVDLGNSLHHPYNNGYATLIRG